jgi:hypothetical protein
MDLGNEKENVNPTQVTLMNSAMFAMTFSIRSGGRLLSFRPSRIARSKYARSRAGFVGKEMTLSNVVTSNAEVRGASQLAGAASRSNAELGEEG